MPLRKKIPGLKDLSIDNIFENIVVHGEKFKKCRTDEKDYVHYKLLQYLFTDNILQKFFAVFHWPDRAEKNLRKLINFLKTDMEIPERRTPKEEAGCPENWPCLKLLFNEYTTTCALPTGPWSDRGISKMTEYFYFLVASECKNLKRVDASFRSLIDERFLNAIPQFQNLREANIAWVTGNDVLKEVLKKCLFIRKLTVFNLKPSSDKFLFCLCTHCSQQEKFILCPDKGNCSKAGKYLESLFFWVSDIEIPRSGGGIPCALQHLSMLKGFYDLPLDYAIGERHYLPDVLEGIVTLQNAAIDSGKSPLVLELTVLNFQSNLNLDELRTVLLSCPKLESVQVDLSVTNSKLFTMSSFENLKELYLYNSTNEKLKSTDLQQLLASRGKELKALNFVACTEPLQLTHVNDTLGLCCNLKQLRFFRISLTDGSYNCNRGSPSCAVKLEEFLLELNDHETSQPCCDYFCDLLCDASNMKYLTVVGNLAENELQRAMLRNEFHFLEELWMYEFDASSIPLEKLVNANNNLRKIAFDTDRPKKLCNELKAMAEKNNFELEVSDVRSY